MVGKSEASSVRKSAREAESPGPIRFHQRKSWETNIPEVHSRRLKGNLMTASGRSRGHTVEGCFCFCFY